MNALAIKKISEKKTFLGIEFGSTRIKAVLIDDEHQVLADGGFGWENHLIDGIWSYPLSEIIEGLQTAYADLKKNVRDKYGLVLNSVGGIGISAMMHGYLAFDKNGKLLVPFRTWRNTMTGPASEELTGLLDFHIPQRWSIAHLAQAVMNKEEHIGEIDHINTLAGMIHEMLSGKRVMGIGEASGMFPVAGDDFDADRLAKAQSWFEAKGMSFNLKEVLPTVLMAGDDAGSLTLDGAKLLDVDGDLEAGIPLCPPEGDAGTGMVATNAVRVGTGNVSAGTSTFGMIVMDGELSKAYDVIDVVTTPDGAPVAMVHVNNGSSDLNAWVSMLGEAIKLFAPDINMGAVYGALFNKALEGDKDCGGVLAYNYVSGEHITELTEGRPLITRMPDAQFSLANVMRANLMTAFCPLKIGFDLLKKEENKKAVSITGHGGIFKTPVVGQSLLAAALDAPVSVMETAGEGGAYGMAVLAAYRVQKNGKSLPDYLDEKVFASASKTTISPDAADVKGFDEFLEKYKTGLAIEREAIVSFK